MTWHKWLWITRILYLGGIALFVGGIAGSGALSLREPLSLAGCVLLVAGFICAAFKLKCPHCGERISGILLAVRVPRCPHCRKPLD